VWSCAVDFKVPGALLWNYAWEVYAVASAISPSSKNDRFKTHHMCIKFCLKLGKTGRETFRLLKWTFKEGMMSWTEVFDWFSKFKCGVTCVKYSECLRHPSMSETRREQTGLPYLCRHSTTYGWRHVDKVSREMVCLK